VNGGPTLSPLGFGCAPMMGRVGRRDSLRALALAFELGVTHFDVARSYGFGRAEALLGEFIAGRRGQVSIATKFGIVPPVLGLKARMAMPLARALARHAPALQARLRRESARLLAAQRFDAAYARQALHESLAQLRTDHVDVLLLHEPPPLPQPLLEDIADALDTLVREGKARRWGIAYAEPADHTHFARCGHAVLQAEAHLGTAAAWAGLRADARPRIAMRPFAGGPRTAAGAALLQRLQGLVAQQASAAEAARWAALAPLGVARALAGAGGSVVCAMYSEPSIRANVAAMRTLTAMPADERRFFDHLLDAACAAPATAPAFTGAAP